MLHSILNTALHAAEGYVLLLLVIRVFGRKALSEMTLFNFVLAITVGSLAAHVSLAGDNSPASTVTALLTFGILGFITDLIHMKSLRIRKLINSEPIVLIDSGQVVKANMAKVRVTLTELTAMLRSKSVFNLSDVNYAIMENNGVLSVLLKADKSPLTPSDMNLNPVEKKLTRDIIMDGKLLKENLKNSDVTEQELLERLQSMGIRDPEEVFYAGLDSSGQLYISKGEDGGEQGGKYGIE